MGQDDGTKKGCRTSWKDQRMELFSRLEEHRILTTCIVDKISDQLDLLIPFRRVKRNGGSAGIDGLTLGEYDLDLSANSYKFIPRQEHTSQVRSKE